MILLLVGGSLIISGVVVSLFHPTSFGRFSWILVLIGLVLMRIARMSSRDSTAQNSIKVQPMSDHSKRQTINIAEFLAYCVASVLTVTVIGAAYVGYFNNLLTDAFSVAIAVAVIIWFARRLFHLF